MYIWKGIYSNQNVLEENNLDFSEVSEEEKLKKDITAVFKSEGLTGLKRKKKKHMVDKRLLVGSSGEDLV